MKQNKVVTELTALFVDLYVSLETGTEAVTRVAPTELLTTYIIHITGHTQTQHWY